MASNLSAGGESPPVVHSKACIFEIRRDAVRVKAKKVDGYMQPEYRRFSVDPQITTFEVLVALLARAFDIPTDFTISYVAHDANARQDVYVSLLSDWDLDAAFLSASHPHLRLKVDVKPFEPGLEDWDILSPLDVSALAKTQQQQQQWEFGEKRRANSNFFAGRRPSADGFFGASRISPTQVQHMQHLVSDKLPNAFASFSSQVGKAFTSVSQAMRGDHMMGDRLSETILSAEARFSRPLKPPMSQTEFQNFLDSDGRLIKPLEFRRAVYHGGVDPSMRRSLWPHLLNVYPENLSGQQRIDYMKRKVEEYGDLLNQWTNFNHDGGDERGYTNEEVRSIMSMVQKDVLRTDRTHKFYSGTEENANIVKLFNVLVTYALNHPKVSYCQGMGDLASPILVVMGDEARSYVCFCGLMRRVDKNFMTDGIAMTTKFKHLALLLEYHDPVFSQYLKDEGALDLFFCYRWLLLELKREFPFDEALMMLEIHWSSFYPNPPATDLLLTDYGDNVEAESLVRPDDIKLRGKNSSFNSPSFPSSLRSNQGESVMSKSVPPPRPPPPVARESTFPVGSYQTHYTRLRDQVRQFPTGSNSSLRPASPYLPTKGAVSNSVSPDVSPVNDVLMPTPASVSTPTLLQPTTTISTTSTTTTPMMPAMLSTSTAEATSGSELRKPSVISADGDFNVVFETSLTKTVAMTKTFLDRHLETLSGVTNTSKDSLLKATEKRTSSLKSMLGNTPKVPGGLSLDSLIEKTSDLTGKASDLTVKACKSNNPFLNAEKDQNGESISTPSPFFADISSTSEAAIENGTTNPFLVDQLDVECGDGSTDAAEPWKNGGDDNNNNDNDVNHADDDDQDDSSSETGGCDSVSSQLSSLFIVEESDLVEEKTTTTTTTTAGIISSIPQDAFPRDPSNTSTASTTMTTMETTITTTTAAKFTSSDEENHRLSIITDPIEVSMCGGGKRVVLVSTPDSELHGPSSIDERQPTSTDSSATWYCDPFLGHPDESSLKDVTFLDSCESAHESVEASQENDAGAAGGGAEAEVAAAAAAAAARRIGVGTAVDGTGVEIIGSLAKPVAADENGRGRSVTELSSASINGPRTVTLTSFNEFDKNVMQTMMESDLVVDGVPSSDPRATPVTTNAAPAGKAIPTTTTPIGRAIPTTSTTTAPLLVAPLRVEQPSAVKQRRSSSLSNADLPPPSFGSLSVDFVQVSNSETPKLEPLPLPEILGDGCPFLLFLCLTLLLQQRDIVLKRHFDCNEIAIHFDKMVRRHRVEGVLCQARHLYAEYLRRHQIRLQEEEIRQLEGENYKLSAAAADAKQRSSTSNNNNNNTNGPLAMPSSVGDLGISV